MYSVADDTRLKRKSRRQKTGPPALVTLLSGGPSAEAPGACFPAGLLKDQLDRLIRRGGDKFDGRRHRPCEEAGGGLGVQGNRGLIGRAQGERVAVVRHRPDLA